MLERQRRTAAQGDRRLLPRGARAAAIFTILTAVVGFPEARAQTAADSAAILGTARDYIEGWYTADAARMARALHPDLAKRIVTPGPAGDVVRAMSRDQLVQAAAAGAGASTPAGQRRSDVTILDVFGNIADVKVVAGEWVDYLHIGRVDGRWVVINVLWELTDEAKARLLRRADPREDKP